MDDQKELSFLVLVSFILLFFVFVFTVSPSAEESKIEPTGYVTLAGFSFDFSNFYLILISVLLLILLAVVFIIYKKVKKLLRESYCQRRLGSTSLDLAMVATGQYDAHVSLSGGVKLNDLGAAPLIIEEAGGVVKMNIFNKNGFKITDNFIKYFLDMDKIENKTYRNLRFNIIAANNKIILNKIIKLLPKQEQNNF